VTDPIKPEYMTDPEYTKKIIDHQPKTVKYGRF